MRQASVCAVCRREVTVTDATRHCSQAVERASELSSLYETAREQYSKLEQRLGAEQRAHEATQEGADGCFVCVCVCVCV